jgi:Uma2 family endonuclease
MSSPIEPRIPSSLGTGAVKITIAKFTVDEYHQLVQHGLLEGRHIELLQGLITEMSPEGPIHSNTIRNIGEWFRQQLGNAVLVSEAHPITLATSEPEPDIAIVVRRDYVDRHPNAQDVLLLIEVAFSSVDKDLNEKKQAYANAGIADYWLVNLQAQELVILRSPSAGDYQCQQILTAGSIAPLHFSELEVPVSVLLGG